MRESEDLDHYRGTRSHQFAIKASEWALANGSPERGWEKAHTPLPQDLGDEWVWLPHDLHQIHGILQSIDMGRACFFPPDARRFLLHCFFCSDWFYLWDEFEKWFIYHQSRSVTIRHRNTPFEVRQELGRKYMEIYHKEKREDGRGKNAVENCQLTVLWEVTYPDGTLHIHSGLRRLCLDYDLKQGKLTLVAQGKRNHHKQFKVKKIGPSPFLPE